MKKFDQKAVIVTGGARGQGAAHARAFVAEGAHVIITDIVDDEGAALAEELGSQASYRRLDVSSESDWLELAAFVQAMVASVDVLVNNAGITHVANIVDCDVDDFRRVQDINVIGTFLGIKIIAPLMLNGGAIINISSVQGIRGRASTAPYTASKFAIRGLTKTAALELADKNIRVNAVLPGGVDTRFIRTAAGLAEDAEFPLELASASVPLKKIATPEDIARLVLFLASEDSGYCTGAELVADGGLTISY